MNNKLKFVVGTSDFKEVSEGNYLWVDKSLFIKNVLDMSDKVTLVTRPRRFGKTLNMSMLSYFFDIKNAEENRKLFSGTKIEALGDEYMQHQGKYPVVFITLKDVKASEYLAAYNQIQILITELHERFAYLLEGSILSKSEAEVFNKIINRTATKMETSGAIKKLCEYLLRYHKVTPIILIDEYDTPINAAFCADDPYHKQMIDFMVSFFGSSLKDNKFLKRAVITGILKIAQSNLFSGINNIGFCALLDKKCVTDFGFIQEEVDGLFGLFKDREYDKNLIKSWYNGYIINGTEIYNPWSIVKCLDNDNEARPYWVESGETTLVKHVIKLQKSLQLQEDFKTLLARKTITSELTISTVMENLSDDREALLTLLHFTGYLNAFELPRNEQQIGISYEFSVPNREILEVYHEWLRSLFEDREIKPSYLAFLKALRSANIPSFKERLQNYLDCSSSYFDVKNSGGSVPEQFYHAFVLGIISGLNSIYIIESNLESGKGRFDIAMIPYKPADHPGFIFEFKSTDIEDDLMSQAEIALKQILDKQYQNRFKAHNVKRLYAIGISCCKKQIEMVSRELLI